jgi:hypothetical protein
MALQQHHLLSDVTVRGFVAGATNILFRQQRHLSDAIVDVSPALHLPPSLSHSLLSHSSLHLSTYPLSHRSSDLKCVLTVCYS